MLTSVPVPEQEPTYLFIDGAHLQIVYRDNFEKIFTDPYEVDFEKVKRAFGARKAFYYDCLDSQQGDDEEDHAFKSRVKSQQDYFDRIRAIPGMHVREGHLSQGKKKQQKEVDVLLSVEMLTHAFNKNITKAVLLSGDRDFKPLVDALVRIGTWVHVAYDPRIGSKDLARAADDHSRLDIVTLCSWVKTDSDARGPYHFPVHYSGFDYDDPILRNNPETRIVNEGTVQHEGKTLAIRLYHDGARYFIGFHPTSGSFEHLNFTDEEKLVKVAELQFGPITWK